MTTTEISDEALASLLRVCDNNGNAILRVFATAAERGAAAAVEELADYCNGCDLVSDESEAAFDKWIAKGKP